MELVHTETDAQGVTYQLYIEQDDQPVRGNAVVSGDADFDKQVEDEILARLDAGDNWAWAAVEVVALYEGFTAAEYLGACSYKNTADFITPDGYYPDMKKYALATLISQLEKAGAALATLKGGA